MSRWNQEKEIQKLLKDNLRLDGAKRGLEMKFKNLENGKNQLESALVNSNR